MNIYLIEPLEVTHLMYDAAVVVASSAKQASLVHPQFGLNWDGRACGGWCKQEEVSVELIGIAEDHLESGTVICAG